MQATQQVSGARSRKISRDLALATFGQATQKVAGYVVLMLLARHLEPSQMGQFFFAATLTALVALVTELGTHQHMVREAAERPDRALQSLSEVLALRLPIGAAAFTILNAVTFIVRPDLLEIMLLTSLYVLAGDLYYSFAAFFTGLRRMLLRVLTAVLGQALVLLLVGLATLESASLRVILMAYAVANGMTLLLCFLVVWHGYGTIRLHVDVEMARRVLLGALPLFLLAVLGMLHFKLDSLMLFALRTPAEMASYEAAYKLLEVGRFVVRPLAMVFLPIASALTVRRAWPELIAVLRRLLVGVTAAGGVITAATLGLAEPITLLVWGASYGSSAPLLSTVFLSLPAVYAGFVLGFVANAVHIERQAVGLTLVAVIANTGLNLLAIPRWGALGAAWTTVLTQTILTLTLMAAVVRHLKRRRSLERPLTGLTGGSAA